ncbi:MAG TPA: ABC transporter permease [Verrucomicrobiales bacterium]|nr:ABC transporter permease [Verrucomicrobiales bacterium]
MWAYIFRKLIYNIPIYLGIILLMMAALRVNDPIWAYLGKYANQERYDAFAHQTGLDQPFVVQYASFLKDVFQLNFSTESWDKPGVEVGAILKRAIVPSLALTVPALVITSVISICIGLLASFYRGSKIDQGLVILAVLGMSISFLVYIIIGQYFGAYWLNQKMETELFAIAGYEPGLLNWPRYCLLPVLISVIVAMGYDTRFYRAVMVEECTRDYITTAQAKGASRKKIMFVHMLKNAMIPIITRIMITLPFLITGSILLEWYFNIPGMGRTLLTAINAKDCPIIQVFTAMFAALLICTNILTDILYAVVDPRVRLS